jgi:hypothetical protein
VVTHTRRAALLAGAAAALAGCGAQSERGDDEPAIPGTSATGRRADAEVLNAALEVKLRALRRYDAFPALRRAGAVEQRHVEQLTAGVRALGAQPLTSADDTDEGGLAPLAEREEWTIAALQDLLPKLSDRELRSHVAAMLVEDAGQLAEIRIELGQDPAPDAFLAPEGPA